MVIKAADAISAGRPGARQESIGRYIERIKALEEIPGRFNGVKRAFAISAGREVRVLVDAQTLKDEDLAGLAKTVAETIEAEVGYPGKVKINVIRRTQTSEYTR
jgi:ribonuclease Y